MSNESITNLPRVLTLGNAKTVTSYPNTNILLTPSVLIRYCFISEMPLTNVLNRLEVKLNKGKALELSAHFNKLTGDLCKNQININALATADKFIAELCEGLADDSYVYITVPLVSKTRERTSSDAYFRNQIIQYHKILFESLIFGSVLSVGDARIGDAVIPEQLSSCPVFYLLPEFTPYLNGEEVRPCSLCAQNKCGTLDKKSCIFYTSGYECLFASDFPILSPEVQVSKLAATMAFLDDTDFKLVNEAESSADLEKAWLDANPEYNGL